MHIIYDYFLLAGDTTWFELPAGPEPGYSQVEREAGGPQARLLVHTDPLPQTLYRVDSQQAAGSVVLVHVHLAIAR